MTNSRGLQYKGYEENLKVRITKDFVQVGSIFFQNKIYITNTVLAL